MIDITDNSHSCYLQRIHLFIRWVLASTFAWLVFAVVFICIGMLLEMSNPNRSFMVSGISKTIYEIIIIFPLLIFPLLLGFIHWKVLSPTRHSCYRWMLGYLLAAVLGFIIGALVSEWLYPSGPDEFTTSYLYSETLPYYLSLGLGIGIAQFLLLRSEIRYPLLLVVSTTLGIFLAWEIQMSSWGYDVGRQYSPHLDGLMLLVVMGAVANSLTGILAALLHRRPFKIEHTAA